MAALPRAQAEQIVDRAVIVWRPANRGAALPFDVLGKPTAGWTTLLNQMHLRGHGQRIELSANQDRLSEAANLYKATTRPIQLPKVNTEAALGWK